MTTIRMFAGTDVGLRENNEDNFIVCPNISLGKWVIPDPQQILNIGECGCIMVVADGMGGQNAGEVASAIAVQTVEEMFSLQNLPANILERPTSIKSYLKKTIVDADLRIKNSAVGDANKTGMGSTIVIVWLIDNKAYIAWLGDSRAYSFLSSKGIGRLSKDHSYVQQLVDNGIITEEEALVHPQSNVITRSLGDTSVKANPDVIEHTVSNGEIILLCSDGLCGVCSDHIIENILSEYQGDLKKCKEKLTETALELGGSDNISITLMQINTDAKPAIIEKKNKLQGSKTIVFSLSAFLIIFLGCFGILKFNTSNKSEPNYFISFSLMDDMIRPGEKIKFSLKHGDGECQFDYNRRLLDLNFSDSTISIANNANLNRDINTTIRIHYMDTTLQKSIKLLRSQTEQGIVETFDSVRSNKQILNIKEKIESGIKQKSEGHESEKPDTSVLTISSKNSQIINNTN